MIATFFLLLITGCWAPEVKPPEPKLSPRELNVVEPAEKKQPSQPPTDPVVSSSKEPLQEETTIPESTVLETQYPFSTTTTQKISLMGHGGGQIMLIPTGSKIDVLEKKDSRYHIICKDCSPNRPRQAGFISSDAL